MRNPLCVLRAAGGKKNVGEKYNFARSLEVRSTVACQNMGRGELTGTPLGDSIINYRKSNHKAIDDAENQEETNRPRHMNAASSKINPHRAPFWLLREPSGTL